jgi:nucleoside-diphosphate-sugar epimerase
VRVLVLGGTGLISAGITAQLLARGDEVTVFNRGATPHAFGGQVRTVLGDRRDGEGLARAVSSDAFDAVVDMVCFEPDDVPPLLAAVRGRVPHLVWCSTVDVYTKGGALPVTEDSPRDPSPDFPYAYQKRRCEALLEDAQERGDVGVTLLRPAATYRDSAVAPFGSYPTTVARLRAGQPIVLHGDGTGLWATCHRDDVAAAFVAALGNPAAVGRAYTLAGSELLTWNAYWTQVAHALGFNDPDIVHIPSELLHAAAPDLAEWCWVNFRYDNVFDCSAAERDLGFRQRTTWAQGTAAFDVDAVPAPDPVEAARYQAVVDAWAGASSAMVARLRGADR